ncbi:MAG: hypothetical protein A2275_03875 [Bacteroidetes bacterium RIFOXYA12_FULL_35_11]|nr:MAG: hypothetical protein A2X01_02815 [Bacteroidetes bacterium GWF2_35_48]OFY73430.1 MAG: hypothetical protein A2275_03875 [Bacteroidetes bacterium RIFOXYA12_FULL_35_11]OFY94986.1 MAG: hypothetical protein A2491_12145 [Bacteroidetes bacterium RIFOXYC12_FULL_35_7]HBX51273.1 hypothetical protein [Bacteroidales bacterium]
MKFLFPLFLLFLFSIKIFAQLSQGGVPLSFEKNISSSLKKNIPAVSIPLPDIHRLVAEDLANDKIKEIPWRFGFPYDIEIDFKKKAVFDQLENGDRLWRLRIYSEGALSFNFRFSSFHLPPGAKLFIYNEPKTEILGAFTEKNNRKDNVFATTLISGESVILEYHEPAIVSFDGALIIDRVVHGYRNAFEYAKGFGGSGSCNVNVACPESQGWDDQIRSVCMLVVNNNAFCSGVLVNNTANDGAPYVLTANHCSSSSNFSSWIFWFNWQSPACPNPAASPSHDQVSISGCELKARNAGSDFCLVRMNDVIPSFFHVFYAGWDRSGMPVNSSVCIHHPRGDIKKISFAENPTESEIYSGAPCWRADWTLGATEPGSSGSPLFSSEKKVIGQLYGGPSSCTAPPDDMNDFYGQFSVSWDGISSSERLKDWLDPQGSEPLTIEGYNPPMMAYDAQVLIALVPESFYCTVQTINPRIIIRNLGTNILTSLQIYYSIDNGTSTSFSWSGNLLTEYRDTVVLPGFFPVDGNHTFKCWVALPNGEADMYANNDTITTLFNVNGKPLPIRESFEYSSFPPQGWSIQNPDNAATWSRISVVTAQTGGYSVFMNLYFFGVFGQQDHLISPVINLSASVAPRLFFNVAYSRKDSTSKDTLKVYVSSDCGASYDSVPVYMKTGSDLTSADDLSTMSFIPGNENDWRQDSVSLTAFSGQSLQFKFTCIAGGGNSLYLDNINIDFGSGHQDLLMQDDFSVFPNPCADYFYVKSKFLRIDRIEIFSITGEKVAVFTNKETSKKINVSTLTSGIYFLKITSGNNYFTKKIMIVR